MPTRIYPLKGEKELPGMGKNTDWSGPIYRPMLEGKNSYDPNIDPIVGFAWTLIENRKERIEHRVIFGQDGCTGVCRWSTWDNGTEREYWRSGILKQGALKKFMKERE